MLDRLEDGQPKNPGCASAWKTPAPRLTQAYETVNVDPQHFLLQLRIAYGLPISTFAAFSPFPLEQLDYVALDVIRSAA